MTKTTKSAALSTEAQTPVAAPITPAATATPEAAPKLDIRPNHITLSDYSYKAFPAAVALIRMGWSISTDYPPTMFENTGYATITLDRAKTDPKIAELANKIAEQEETLAAARAAIDFQRQVQEAAKAIVEAERKAAKAAELATEIAAQRAALQALEQAAAAA